jgi:hypothetical protein
MRRPAVPTGCPAALSGGSWTRRAVFLNPIERLQIVVRGQRGLTGTVFFDDIGFK